MKTFSLTLNIFFPASSSFCAKFFSRYWNELSVFFSLPKLPILNDFCRTKSILLILHLKLVKALSYHHYQEHSNPAQLHKSCTINKQHFLTNATTLRSASTDGLSYVPMSKHVTKCYSQINSSNILQWLMINHCNTVTATMSSFYLAMPSFHFIHWLYFNECPSYRSLWALHYSD